MPPVPALTLSNALLFADPSSLALLALSQCADRWRDAIVLSTPFWLPGTGKLNTAVDLSTETISPLAAASVAFDLDRELCIQSSSAPVSESGAALLALARRLKVKFSLPAASLSALIKLTPNLVALHIYHPSQLLDGAFDLLSEKSLEELTVDFWEQPSVDELAQLASLRKITLRMCYELNDISALPTLAELRELSLSSCRELTDLTPLASLTSLQVLKLKRCTLLNDIKPLASFQQLSELTIVGCGQLSDISALESMTGLRKLKLLHNAAELDVSPLCSFGKLKFLMLTTTDDAAETLVDEFESRGLCATASSGLLEVAPNATTATASPSEPAASPIPTTCPRAEKTSLAECDDASAGNAEVSAPGAPPIPADNSAIAKLGQLLGSSSEDVRQEAAWALANLASGDERLQSRGSSRDDEPANPDVSAKTMAEISELVALLSSDDPKDNLKGASMIRELVPATEELPSNDVIGKECIPLLVEQLNRDDMPELQFESAWALTNIAMEHPTRVLKHPTASATVAENAVPSLVHLLSSSDQECCEQAAWMIANLVGDDPECRDRFFYGGVLEPLLSAIRRMPTTSTNSHLFRALSKLCSGDPQPKLEFIASAFPLLINMLNKEDDEVVSYAASAMANLSETIQYVLETESVNRLVELLNHSSPEVIIPVLRTIASFLSTWDLHRETVINGGALAPIHKFFTHRDPLIRKEAIRATSNIAAGYHDHIQAVIDKGMVGSLMHATSDCEKDVRIEATRALANVSFAGTFNHIVSLVDAGVLVCLRDLLQREEDTELLEFAVMLIGDVLMMGTRVARVDFMDHNPYAEALLELDGFFEMLDAVVTENPKLSTMMDDVFDDSKMWPAVPT